MTHTTEVPETSETHPEPPAPPKMLTLQIDDQIDAAIEVERQAVKGGRILSRSEAARRLLRRGAGLASTTDEGPPS